MQKRRYVVLVFMLILFAINYVWATGHYGVCVGIADYPDDDNDVTNNTTVYSATQLRLVLINHQGWNGQNIELVTNSSATSANITNKISAMPNTTGNSNFFHFSGHGFTYALHCYSGTIHPNLLRDSFGSNYNQFCAFIDACYSGIFPANMSNGDISSACTSNEVALAAGEDGFTAYSYYIWKGIKNDNADPASGHVVSASEIHTYAAPKVTSYANNHSGYMHPQKKLNMGVINLSDLGPTSSGTLIDDELWDQNVTLTGNVTIPSGVLVVLYNSSITLGTKYLAITGSGKLDAKGSAVLPADIVIKDGSTVVGYFPSLSSALSYAASGQTIYMNENQTLTSDLVVPDNRTLVIKDGAYLTTNGKKMTTTNGTITVETNATLYPDVRLKQSGVIKGLYPTVQAGINACASNQIVYLKAGSYSENISMTDYSFLCGAGKTQTYIYGTVSFNNVDNAEIQDLRVSEDITISSGDGNWIDNVTAKDIIDIENGVNHIVYECSTTDNGYIDIYCTDPEIEDLTSTNTKTWGIVGYGSDPLITYGTFQNKTRAIHLGSSMDADIDNVDFCTQTGASEYDIYAISGSHADVTVGSGSFSECPFPNSFYGDVDVISGSCCLRRFIKISCIR